jgi:hypothetical protein
MSAASRQRRPILSPMPTVRQIQDAFLPAELGNADFPALDGRIVSRRFAHLLRSFKDTRSTPEGMRDRRTRRPKLIICLRTLIQIKAAPVLRS